MADASIGRNGLSVALSGGDGCYSLDHFVILVSVFMGWKIDPFLFSPLWPPYIYREKIYYTNTYYKYESMHASLYGSCVITITTTLHISSSPFLNLSAKPISCVYRTHTSACVSERTAFLDFSVGLTYRCPSLMVWRALDKKEEKKADDEDDK